MGGVAGGLSVGLDVGLIVGGLVVDGFGGTVLGLPPSPSPVRYQCFLTILSIVNEAAR